jgi:anti-sigma-K factor RskA
MFNDYQYVVLHDRTARERDFAERVAERRRYARPPGAPSVRARVARRLFALAVATERNETWRLVWERLEAKGRL